MANLREYHRPETVEHALKLLSREGLHAAPLGGGTQLAAESCRGLEAAIDLSALPLAYVTADSGVLRVGSLTRLEELSKTSAARGFAGGALADAARLTCTSLLRNQATVAGTILSPGANGELAAALLVLEAEALFQTPEGPVTRPISYLLEKPETCRRAILVEVRVPEPPFGSLIRRERIARTPGDRAIVSVTVVAQTVAGSITTCRIAAAGAGLQPVRLRDVETALAGAAASADLIASALKKEVALLELHDSPLASTEYLRAMLPVLISRAMLVSGR